VLTSAPNPLRNEVYNGGVVLALYWMSMDVVTYTDRRVRPHLYPKITRSPHTSKMVDEWWKPQQNIHLKNWIELICVSWNLWCFHESFSDGYCVGIFHFCTMVIYKKMAMVGYDWSKFSSTDGQLPTAGKCWRRKMWCLLCQHY
jgi:hypothetical protein